MTKSEAHELLNAAKAGLWVSQLKITQALMATGDLSHCQRSMNEPEEVTHAVPAFERIPYEPMPEKNKAQPYVMSLPKIVHKPWVLA